MTSKKFFNEEFFTFLHMAQPEAGFNDDYDELK